MNSLDYVARSAIYELAIEHWGGHAQKLMAVEEMSELAAELLKDLDGHGSAAKVIEELADVENVCKQLRIIYDEDGLTDGWRDLKMLRAVRRIDDESHEN